MSKKSLNGDSILEIPWISKDVEDAQAGQQVEMGQSIEDVSKGDDINGDPNINE